MTACWRSSQNCSGILSARGLAIHGSLGYGAAVLIAWANISFAAPAAGTELAPRFRTQAHSIAQKRATGAGIDGATSFAGSDLSRLVAAIFCPSCVEGHDLDFNGDGRVSAADVVALVQSVPPTPPTATPIAVATPTPSRIPTPPTAFSGLEILDRVDVPSGLSGTPHLFDIVVEGQRVYLANSFGAAVAYEVEEAGLSLAFFSEPLLMGLARCTSLAIHTASRRLYCAAVDVAQIAMLDADTGDLLGPGNFLFEWSRGYRDLHVVGDSLYLAAFDAGLLRAQILADGSLGSLEQVLEGEIVGVAGTAEQLAVLDRHVGLRILESGVEGTSIALDGPPMRLSVNDGVAAVALGSRGAIVVDLTSRNVLAAAHPKCVAVDAAYRDGALAIACTTGVYLYQTQPNLRTAGWDPAVYASLGVRFVGDVLVAQDWRIVTAYRVNTAGRALGVDAPRGFLLESGQGIRFAVRNPDDKPQTLAGEVLPPLGELMIEVPPAAGDEVVALATDEQADRIDPAIVHIVRGRPRAPFGGIFPIPLSSRYVTFLQPDCALQFPAVEDLTWLTAHGMPPEGLHPLVLMVPSNDGDPWSTGGFLRLWGEPLEAILLVDAYPVEGSSFEVFETHFTATHYTGGADTTIELSIDANGRVDGFDRVYRGAHSLSAESW